MTSWRLALLGSLLIGSGGCGSLVQPNPLSCLDGFCSDQGHPFCDVDGSFGGTPGLCLAVECTPLAFESCRGDEALTCNTTGDDYDIAHCEFGCDTDGCKQCTPGTPGCEVGVVHIIPKYLPTVCDTPATTAELTISSSMTFDTDVDANCNGGVVTQNGGPNICIVRYGTITIDTNKTLTVVGKRAIALVADQAVTISGVLDASANGIVNGPGGGFIPSPGTLAAYPAGGGGAGFKTAGAPGGTLEVDGGAANGGATGTNPAQLVELVGGTRSIGAGAFVDVGGGGGGAATLISCRGAVSVTGMIDVGGGGGTGGGNDFGTNYPSSGGGSGGNVVFQGMAVVITGQAFANGGGGGAGQGGAVGLPGDDGSRSSTTSAKGGITDGGGGTGGDGGRVGAGPTSGRKPANSFASAGAGGGSTGFFKTYTPADVTPTIVPAAASPAFEANGTIQTRR